MISTDNKIWVKKNIHAEKSVGGIILSDADDAAGGIREGYVVKVGTGRYNPLNGERVPCCVKPGDHVIFNASTGAACLIILTNKETNKQESYYVMNDNEVIGILDDEKEALTVRGDGSIPEEKKNDGFSIITPNFGV